ncbi:MAG: DNA packaging protein [Nitrospiraceae bacterium]|nr:MAG: DNA packaging protein [Nitrospiraceae bacterium]
MDKKRALEALLIKLDRKLAYRRLEIYRPYPKQREFHAAGQTYPERLLMAGNQVGKTLCAAAEVAMHLTGRYPDWWPGKVFGKQVVGWVAGVTGEATRDNAQRMLMGRINAIGTGMIPRDAIKEWTPRRGVADAIDTVIVRHGGGGDVQAGESLLSFKSYDQGREKFQGETLDFGWCDEEPPVDVYTEFLTRLAVLRGPMLVTFTPLKGMSEVVLRFLQERPPGTYVVNMTIEDAEHFDPEQRAEIIARYPPHEREARAKGVPVLGSGRVFPVSEESLVFDLFEFPPHWPRICGLDFGWDHPTAAVWAAWDRDTDTFWVYDVYRAREQPVVVHAAAIKARGSWIPVAWPHDGLNETAAGPALAKQYAEHGLAMLPEHAKIEPMNDRADLRRAATSVEAGVQEMLDAMLTGRFRVARHLNEWWEEFRMYHREEGKIVKLMDDLMCATRYAYVSRRHAQVAPSAYRRLTPNRAFNWRAP